jgi:ribokinase
LCEQRPLDAALRRASAASALACTRLGAQTGVPMRAEVDALAERADAPMTTAWAELAAYCGLPEPAAR